MRSLRSFVVCMLALSLFTAAVTDVEACRRRGCCYPCYTCEPCYPCHCPWNGKYHPIDQVIGPSSPTALYSVPLREMIEIRMLDSTTEEVFRVQCTWLRNSGSCSVTCPYLIRPYLEQATGKKGISYFLYTCQKGRVDITIRYLARNRTTGTYAYYDRSFAIEVV